MLCTDIDWDESPTPLTTDKKNNMSSYDLGRYHAWEGEEENLSHCLGPESEAHYKMGYKKGLEDIQSMS